MNKYCDFYPEVRSLGNKDLNICVEKYVNVLHEHILTDIKKRNKDCYITYLYSKMIQYGKYEFLKYLRITYPEIYLNKSNYKPDYNSFSYVFWKKAGNETKTKESVIKTIEEIYNYGLDTIFNKYLSKSLENNKLTSETHKFGTVLESPLTSLFHPHNKINIKLREEIYNYITKEHDFTNTVFKGTNLDQVKYFISEMYLNNNRIEKDSHSDDLLFLLHRYKDYAVKVLFISMIENFGGLSDIRFKNNPDIDKVIQKLCNENIHEIGFKKYFENININNFREEIFKIFINNFEMWVDEWVDDNLSIKDDPEYSNKYNLLNQQAYRCIFCALGNYYYYAKDFIDKKIITKKIKSFFQKNDKIFIEHSILYFFANCGFDFENLSEDEAEVISIYLEKYLVKNKNIITKIYIIDTFNQVYENGDIKTLL